LIMGRVPHPNDCGLLLLLLHCNPHRRIFPALRRQAQRLQTVHLIQRRVVVRLALNTGFLLTCTQLTLQREPKVFSLAKIIKWRRQD
jgi:hypothetical protein